MALSPFFQLHSGLEREGPGEPADVDWAMSLLGLAADARIADVASGPGGDIADLLRHAPEARLTAIDKQPHFVAAVAKRFANDARVTALQGDMADIGGPYDLIWCAGAIYFLGVTEALTLWRPSLAQGGAIAFTAPCHFAERPSDTARAFWDGDPVSESSAHLQSQIEAACFALLGSRPLADSGWQSYITPLQARIEALRPDASPDSVHILNATESDHALWPEIKHETGYLQCVVHPI